VNDEEFRLLDEIEEDHWWLVGKRLLTRSLIASETGGGRLLDLGCGTGGLLRDSAAGADCVGVDRSALGLRICARKGLERLVRADVSKPPFRAGAFDTLLALDVIEHLDDDVAFLRRARDLCAPGGHFMVSVPAFPWLWSRHDETFEHRRRYTARTLQAALLAAGFVPERLTYTNLFVFPAAAAWRIATSRLGLERFLPRTDFVAAPRWLNTLLVRLYELEVWLLSRVDLPFGLSVVCIARAPHPAGHADD
jgi:SAM-dependent methyltransferase